VYALIVGVIFISLFSLGIVLLVWLSGGVVPDSGNSKANAVAGKVVEKTEDPVNNFVGCVYDVCCITRVANKTTFPVESCFMDINNVPDINGVEVFNPTMSGDEIDVSQYKEASKSCTKFKGIMNKGTCESGSYVFRQAVAQWMNENVKPLAHLIIAMAVLIFSAWVFAVLEIFWCCGQSDLPPIDDTKVFPGEYDDDY
jgi:hypothetical protein